MCIRDSLYAVRANDPTEAKVGSWEFPRAAEAARFRAMDGPVWTSALPKRYTEHFWFRAPPAGTGPLVFRALLKQGDTLGGHFYWPATAQGSATDAPPQDGVAGGDLTLSEAAPAAAPAALTWLRGDAGASCAAVCAAAGRTCDDASFGGAASAAELLARISSTQLCAPPLLSSCAAYAPSSSDLGDGWCWFADPDPAVCPAASAAPPSCAAVPPAADAALSGARFCPCAAAAGGGRRLLTTDDGGGLSLIHI